MQYLGGKSRLAKDIVATIRLKCPTSRVAIEPFCGGGAVTKELAKNFDVVKASDIHEDLILMWKALQNGWIPPKEISFDEYTKLKIASPSALRGFAGFAQSWGGKWFGGYARFKNENYAKKGYNSILNITPYLHKITYKLESYKNITFDDGDLIYCDPPYKNHTGYLHKNFNHDEFWATVRDWKNKGAKVFVSEFEAPEDFQCIWSKERKLSVRGDLKTAKIKTEKLFTLN